MPPFQQVIEQNLYNLVSQSVNDTVLDCVGLHYTALALKTKHIIAEWEIMLVSQSQQLQN